MNSKFQKFLYTYGIVSPLIVIAISFYWYKSKVILNWQIIVLIISGGFFIYHWHFIKIVTKKLPLMDFRASETPEENDSFAWGFLGTYFAPIIEWLLDFVPAKLPEIPYSLLIAIIAFWVALTSNKTYGSPIYFIRGYHFHYVKSESGKTFVLMSKKKHYRSEKQIKRIIRLFENLLIDAG
ncbi:MAG: hypothetical protein HFI67_02245 [Lachnospiraceae bacterium]|nr:hypothetical protein [Lachnospiraceae bacterium]